MTDQPNLISEAFVSGEDIAPIIERVEVALDNIPRTHALTALTSMILILQSPDISTEQMYEGVKDISRFVCMWLAGADTATNTEPLPKEQMN